MAKSLFHTLTEEEPTEWIIAEIKAHLTKGGVFNSKKVELIIREIHSLTTTPDKNPSLKSLPLQQAPTQSKAQTPLLQITPILHPLPPIRVPTPVSPRAATSIGATDGNASDRS